MSHDYLSFPAPSRADTAGLYHDLSPDADPWLRWFRMCDYEKRRNRHYWRLK